jgi:hypothetical protein
MISSCALSPWGFSVLGSYTVGELGEQDPAVDLAQNGRLCAGETLRQSGIATR